MGKAKYPHDPDRPESPAVKKALEAMDMDALRDALTFRQRRFCEEYVVDFNGAAAAVRAGYANTYPDRQAYQLMQNKGVTTYIEFLTISNAAKMVSIDGDYIIQGILKVIHEEANKAGDKLRGYELLARLKGLFIDKQEITGKNGGAIEVEQRRIDEESSDFIRAIKDLNKKTKT